MAKTNNNMSILDSLNNSKYFAGLMMIILNLGSKYLVLELSETQEKFLSNTIIRRFIIFTIVFIATRDIYVSFILTAIFIIFVSGLFNEKSSLCIFKKSKKRYEEKKKKIRENNKNKKVTKEEYEKAVNTIIKLYNEEK